MEIEVTGSHDTEDKNLKKLELFCINIFMISNLVTVPKSVSSDSARGSGDELTVLLLLTLGEPQ